MRMFLTQIEKKHDNPQVDDVKISQILTNYDNIKKKYFKYVILNIITLGIVAKFRRKKLKIKRIMQDQFQKS